MGPTSGVWSTPGSLPLASPRIVPMLLLPEGKGSLLDIHGSLVTREASGSWDSTEHCVPFSTRPIAFR